MTFLVILFCILIVFSVFFVDNNKMVSPIKFFVCLWGIILILSCVHIGILDAPSNDAYVLLMTMISSFLLGSLICKYINNKKNVEIVKSDTQIRTKLFYALCIIYILFNLVDIFMVLKYRMQGVPMWQIRNWSLQPYGSVNPILSRRSFIETLFRNIVLEPMGLIIYPVTAYLFFTKNVKKEKIITLSIAILCLLTTSIAGGGGRLVYIFFVLSYLLVFLSLYRLKKINNGDIKKYFKVLIVFIIVAFIGVISLTVIRVGKGFFLRQAYKYFAMPPTLLSKWLPKIKNESHTYGLLTTFGIHSYFFRTINQLGLVALVPGLFTKSFNHILNAEQFLKIGSAGVGNAFVTPIYYFYLDGGFVFIVLASLFFGFLVEYVFNRINNNLNIRNFMIYMIIMYGILVSFMRIQTAIPSYIIAIVFVYVLTKKNSDKQHKKNNVVNNSIMLFIFNIAKIVFPFITLPYLTRVLTKDTYGTVTYVKTVMTYMQVFVDFGFVLSGTKDIVKNLSNKEKLNVIIGDTLIARTILGIFGYIVVLVLSLILPILRENIIYTLISYTAVFGSIYLMDFVFRGYEKMHVITIRFILMKTISTILTFVLIKNDSNVLLIPILDVISTAIAIILVMFEQRKLDIRMAHSKVVSIVAKIKDSFIYFLSNVASTSFNALSTIIIGIYLSRSDVACWGLCMQIIGTIQACYSPITDGIYPEMVRSKNLNLIRKILKIFVPIVGVGCIIAYFLAPLGVKILGGNKYIEVVPILRILIPCLFIGFFGILYGWPVLGAINKQKEVTISTASSMIFNVLFIAVLILINRFTLIYIAIGRVLTEIILLIMRYSFFLKYKNEFEK